MGGLLNTMCDLKRLEQITLELPLVKTLKDLTIKGGDGIKTYQLEGGIAYSKLLLGDSDVSVAKTFIPISTIFSTHNHPDSYEYIIIIEGCLELSIDNKKIILEKYDSIKIKQGEPHSAFTRSDTKIVAITIPPDEGFPKRQSK